MRLLLLVAAALLVGVGGTCGDGEGTPSLSITLNAVPDDQNDVLVVPPSGFAANLTYTANGSPIDPQTAGAAITNWGSMEAVDITSIFSVNANGAVGVLPQNMALEPGTHTLAAWVMDTSGVPAGATFDFAVRDYAGGSPPIGGNQFIWFDFESDRDATPGPDFTVDLQSFGLGSPASPPLSDVVRQDVIGAVIARVQEAFWTQDPNGLGSDPIWGVIPVSSDAGVGTDVTRICVGGEDPSGGSTVASVLIDYNNGNRSSVECATLPPTGIFPREMLGWQGNGTFQSLFFPLMSSQGGTPVGEHALDPIVLAPGFDPQTAPSAEADRYWEIYDAVEAFADALGSIMAHETGHALGLCPAGAPGGGLFGDGNGHALTVSGGVPSENILMKEGPAFSFPALAGLNGNPLPYWRELSFAYLADRVVLDPKVTQLLPPPLVTGVTPESITQSIEMLTITGSDFAATPSVTLENASFTYELQNESLVSGTEVRGFAIASQVPSGLYDLVLENPDGQTSRIADAVTKP